MTTLYEIVGALDAALEKYEAGQELAAAAEVNALYQTLDEKLVNICGYYKNLEADVEAIDVERKRLTDKKRVIENRLDWLKQYISFHLPAGKWSNGVHSLSYRASEAAEWIDPDVELPECYRRVKTIVEPDRESIKKDLKCGASIPGWTLAKRNNLQVK